MITSEVRIIIVAILILGVVLQLYRQIAGGPSRGGASRRSHRRSWHTRPGHTLDGEDRHYPYHHDNLGQTYRSDDER